MKTKKRMILVSVLVLLLPAAMLFSSGGTETGVGEEWRIGYSMPSLRAVWWVIMSDGVMEMAEKHPEVTLITAESGGRTEKQIADVNDLITQELDLLLLFPNESKPLVAALNAAQRANVPVINWDIPIAGENYICHVAGDHYGIGKVNAEECVRRLTAKYGEAKGTVLHIQGALGTDTATLRRGGFDDVMKNYPNIKQIGYQGADWYQDRAYKIAKDYLISNPDIDAIYTHSDEMTLGAIKAIEEEGLIGEVMTYSVDGDIRMLKAIKDGKATALGTYSHALGTMAFEIALDFLNGKDVPYQIIAPTYLVTADNVDEFYDPDAPAYIEPDEPAPAQLTWERTPVAQEYYDKMKEVLASK
jgi:ABC-type sugar transport system substrate-binding protein